MGSTGDEEADWECAELMMVRARDRKNGSECSPSMLKTIKNGVSSLSEAQVISHKEAPISLRELLPIGSLYV